MESSVQTVNAAANAIVSAENRVQQVTVPRRRWGGCFSMYWCFGSQRHEKRISHAVLVPEPTLAGHDVPTPEDQNHSQTLTLPFVAPPSSPASFLQSEPPSATQSPAGFFSLSALTSSAYSPTGPSSIFAIGPYANETQLVSPPVFSTFTTEPSTAPFTPPPEPVQLTTPSSPEVPFAKLLSTSFDPNRNHSEPYEFQSYQLYPGSPIGHLISPSSVCSGTSSPFPDLEFHSSGGGSVPTFPVVEAPKILIGEVLAARKLIPLASQDRISPLDGTSITRNGKSDVRPPNDEALVVHRVSFELTAEEVTRCMEKKPGFPGEPALGSPQDTRNMPGKSKHLNAADASCTRGANPEVPFAKLLSSSFDPNRNHSEPYAFQSYQLCPGSPIGHLISPSSVCSGTSSPFPDLEFHSSGGGSVPTFPVVEAPKILTGEVLAARKLIPLASQDRISPLDGTSITRNGKSDVRPPNDEALVVYSVSFELTAEVMRCMEKKPGFPGEPALGSPQDTRNMPGKSKHLNAADGSCTQGANPEVPFAKLLSSSFDPNRNHSEPYDFQSYQLYPGSPICHLISPSSVCSGTSSPFPDLEFHSSGGRSVTTFSMAEAPKILTGEVLAARKLIPLASQDSISPLDGTSITTNGKSDIRPPNDEGLVVHRVSFELTAEEVTCCMEKKPGFPGEPALGSPQDTRNMPGKSKHLNAADGICSQGANEDYHELPEERKHRLMPLLQQLESSNLIIQMGLMQSLAQTGGLM